jgi:hypothetical protein
MRRILTSIAAGCLLVAGLGTITPASASDPIFGRLLDGSTAAHPAAAGMVVKLRTVTAGGPGAVVATDTTDGDGYFQLDPGSSTADEFYIQVVPGTWQGGWVGQDEGGGPEVVQPAPRFARTYGAGDHLGNVFANPAFIRGVVVNAATGNPVAGVTVRARSHNDVWTFEGSDVTDSHGNFRVDGISCEDDCYLKIDGSARDFETGYRACNAKVVPTWGEACASPIGRIGRVRLDHL